MNWGPWDLKASVLTTELFCHYIEFGKKKLEYTFQCKMRKSQFLSKMSADLINYDGFEFGFAWGTNDFYKVSMEHYFLHFFLSYLSWMSADLKNKCWFTIYNRCFIYDSNIYFGALISFFAPSPASTYRIEHLPFSIEDVSQF